MGLTKQSTGKSLLEKNYTVEKKEDNDFVIALAGNPNVGKSTVFNSLTGLNQHTGNWPGKTVAIAQGICRFHERNYILVDLPGTYSLMANSAEEEVARDFICFEKPDAVVVVADATCLERNLNLVLQTLELCSQVVLCVNLVDEAEQKKIKVDFDELALLLGIPVVGTSARSGKGMDTLMDAVQNVVTASSPSPHFVPCYEEAVESAIEHVQGAITPYVEGRLPERWTALKLLDGDKNLINTLNTKLPQPIEQHKDVQNALEAAWDKLVEYGIGRETLRDRVVSKLVLLAEKIASSAVSREKGHARGREQRIDKLLTSRVLGFPLMLAMLLVVFWITISGANVPSSLLATGFSYLEDKLNLWFQAAGVTPWLQDLVISGIYRTLTWVIAVMLPPMAIFFPLFTLLEDLGYLPRIAFNLDHFFKKACAHGKQALTMCMGFGCNAAGVVGCRIIDSPRERLIAVITNVFVPCNGRFPTLIAIITMFFAGAVFQPFQSFFATALLTLVIVLGIFMTLLISKLLSKTLLKGIPSSFALELPPYRKPQIGKVIVRSIVDRTLFVLGRAIAVAAPAGLVIWLFANIQFGGASLLTHCAAFLDPFGRFIGVDGYIIMAFILGLPANEIVIPLLIMSYISSGSMVEAGSLLELKELLLSHGWTWLTALCTMLICLMHFPCGTTLWTIKKETGSLKWTLLSFLIPTLCGIAVCAVIAQISRLLGLV